MTNSMLRKIARKASAMLLIKPMCTIKKNTKTCPGIAGRKGQ
jgi:hypothetical protein